jgi:hypothetical protein
VLSKYFPADESRKDDIEAANGAYWDRGDKYTVLVGKHEGKRALGKSRRRWDDDITMYF